MTYTEQGANNFMEACVALAKMRISSGAPEMAGAYARDAAHFGLMLLAPGISRRRIAGSIASDDLVNADPFFEHLPCWLFHQPIPQV